MSKKPLFLLSCLSLVALVGCGGNKTSQNITIADNTSTTFLYSASLLSNGTTYKLNLKGLSDNTCTLVCAQAATPINYSGKWSFDANKGYSFDFGTQCSLYSGYNAYGGYHYVNYSLKLTNDTSARLQMTYLDSTFKPGDSYQDPCDHIPNEDVYYGTCVTTQEEIRFRDFNDGTFEVMSFGSSAIFQYGTYAEKDGKRVYTFSDSEKTMDRDVGNGTSNYKVTYITSVKGFFGSTDYENPLYHLSGDMTQDEAFPDPRGKVVYAYTGTNTTEFTQQISTYAPGSVTGDLNLYQNETTNAYEISIMVDGSDWFSETGTWALDGDNFTFTPDGMMSTPWTGAKSGFDLDITKTQFFGDPYTVTFHFTLNA